MNADLYIEKIAKMLKAPRRVVADLSAALERLTGRAHIIEKIFYENEARVGEKLAALNISHRAQANDVYDALISKAEADDVHLLGLVGHASLRGYAASRAVVGFVESMYGGSRRGFFLKREKARAFLIAEPPKKILAALGYENIAALLEKEDLDEIYSALRFLEDEAWQNKVFFAQYRSLTPDDFEERDVVIKALPGKWAVVAEKFVTKKYHNVSHLKELGVIFVIPLF